MKMKKRKCILLVLQTACVLFLLAACSGRENGAGTSEKHPAAEESTVGEVTAKESGGGKTAPGESAGEKITAGENSEEETSAGKTAASSITEPAGALDSGPGDISWTLEDGILTISGSGRMENYSYIAGQRAPWYEGDTAVTSVVIEPGVTSIGSYAFYSCKMLTEVSIPDSVTSIGDSAFEHCENLTITIPDSVTYIGSSAFYYCRSLEEVTVPAGVAAMGDNPFAYCPQLTSISVAAGNENFSAADGVLYNKDRTALIAFPAGNAVSSFTVPEGVTGIGGFAFYGCRNLKSVTIPEGVTSIGRRAFNECRLTEVTIPASVTNIGMMAFYECRGLTDVYYGGGEDRWAELSADAAVEETAVIHFE